MMKDWVMIFPGQGVVDAEAIKAAVIALYHRFSAIRHFMFKAEKQLGYNPFRLRDDLFKKTGFAQPGIFLHSVVVAKVLEHYDWIPQALAGHSLGLFGALWAGGWLDDWTALELIMQRGVLTQASADKTPGKMAAIIGMGKEEVIAICSDIPGIEAVNFNGPGQTMISGTIEAVDKACQIFTGKAKKVIPVETGVAFHHFELLAGASEDFDIELNKVGVTWQEVTDKALFIDDKELIAADEVHSYTLGHLARPVDWTSTILNAIKSGKKKFLIVGPGQLHVNIIKRIAKHFKIEGVQVVCLSTFEEIESFVAKPFAG